jgi:hypothetical protein
MIIGPETRVAASTEHLSTTLGDEAVILNLSDSTYYGVDGVGVRIWDLVQTPRTVRELIDTLENEFEVDPAVLQNDVQKFLSTLAERQLVTLDGP